MIKVENKYDFTVDELTDILEKTPIRVDLDTNAAVAEYIIQALNVNRIIKKSQNLLKEQLMNSGEYNEPKPTVEINRTIDRGSPYHLILLRNTDNKKVFECEARTVAFYAYDELLGRPHKGILSEQKPTTRDIANVCELLGDIRDWGTFQ